MIGVVKHPSILIPPSLYVFWWRMNPNHMYIFKKNTNEPFRLNLIPTSSFRDLTGWDHESIFGSVIT